MNPILRRFVKWTFDDHTANLSYCLWVIWELVSWPSNRDPNTPYSTWPVYTKLPQLSIHVQFKRNKATPNRKGECHWVEFTCPNKTYFYFLISYFSAFAELAKDSIRISGSSIIVTEADKHNSIWHCRVVYFHLQKSPSLPK